MPTTRHMFLTKLVFSAFLTVFFTVSTPRLSAHISHDSGAKADSPLTQNQGNTEAKLTLHLHGSARTADLDFRSIGTSTPLKSEKVTVEVLGGKTLPVANVAPGSYSIRNLPDSQTTLTLLVEQHAGVELNMFSFNVSLPAPPLPRSPAVDRAMYILIGFNVLLVTFAAITMYAWYTRDRHCSAETQTTQDAYSVNLPPNVK